MTTKSKQKENDYKNFEGVASEEQIEAWKREHGPLFAFYSEDKKVAYFKKMSLKILDAARSKYQVHESGFKVIILKNTFIGGCKQLIEEEKYQVGLFDWVDVLLVKVEGVMLEL